MLKQRFLFYRGCEPDYFFARCNREPKACPLQFAPRSIFFLSHLNCVMNHIYDIHIHTMTQFVRLGKYVIIKTTQPTVALVTSLCWKVGKTRNLNLSHNCWITVTFIFFCTFSMRSWQPCWCWARWCRSLSGFTQTWWYFSATALPWKNIRYIDKHHMCSSWHNSGGIK